MKTLFGNVNSLIDKIKKIRLREILVTVPPELKAQFEQTQLKNSVFRLRVFGAITVLFNVLNWPIYFIHAEEIDSVLFRNIFFADLFQLFVTILFFLLTAYFSKKAKDSVLRILCYFFIVLYFLISLYSMLYTEIFLVLQIFFTCTFLYIFIPDFKPKIFISFLTLWYVALAGLLAYKSQTFVFGGPQVFALNVFLIALVIRILHYNSIVKTFINTYRISTLNEKLEALSMTDELTKLNNRRSFLYYIDMIWKQSRRLQLPINLLMIDVDYFKKYNDSQGHLEGDKALIAIAQCMKSQVKRDTDYVARFGGEEFICLLPFLEKDKALNFAKDLVQKIEDMKIPHPMSEHSKYVTISIGMASTIPDDHNSQTQLLDEADKALYKAKESGRNRVVAGEFKMGSSYTGGAENKGAES